MESSNSYPEPVQRSVANSREIEIRLTGLQNELYGVLLEREPTGKLASMYYGALMVLAQNNNPERLCLAAHAMRELMEKLPWSLDLPIKTKNVSMRSKIQQLRDSWPAVLTKYGKDNVAVWEGLIERELKRFLAIAEEFFAWLDEERSTRKAQSAKLLRHLDPSQMRLPVPIEEMQVEEWDKLREYFESVAHHHETTDEDFEAWIEAAGRFLLDHLRPRTFEDRRTIDQIIKEGERSAEQ